MISTTTLRQSVTPPSLLGRVSAINIMSYGARPLGAALGAIVGGLYGAEACLYLAAAIFGAQALVILMSPAVSLARQPDMVGDGARRCGPVDHCSDNLNASWPSRPGHPRLPFLVKKQDVDAAAQGRA